MRYIAYCRKSTDEKDKQVLSIEAQIAELKEYAKREKLEIVDFITEARTAKIPGREKFSEVLHHVEKGRADGILSWHPDRLARNSIDGGKIIYLLDLGKIKDLKFPSFWFDNTPQGKFMLNIAFGQSKYYVDNLSENVKRGNRQKLRNGVWPSKAPLGYFNEPKLRTIEVNKETAPLIKKAFDMFVETSSAKKVAEFFHKHGITGHEEKPLHLTAIKNMLSNTFYIGIMKYNGEYYDGTHKVFIEKSVFQNVQDILRRKGKPQTKTFPFLGLAKCGECSASITAERHFKFYPTTRGKVQYIHYRCTKKLRPCTQKYLAQDTFETQLRNIIAAVSLPQEWADEWYKWMERDAKEDMKKIESTIAKLQLEIELRDKKLNMLLDSYLDTVIDPETYKKKKNEIFTEKLQIQEDITKIQETGTSWLEPMREFVDSAVGLEKIARAKNTTEDLVIFAKKIGSNYNLANRSLTVSYKRGFAQLQSIGISQYPRGVLPSHSILVGRDRVELSTSSLSEKRSTDELTTHC